MITERCVIKATAVGSWSEGKALVPQSCPTLFDTVVCSLPCSSAHEILQARILETVAVPFFRGSSLPRVWTQVSCTAGRLFTIRAIREGNASCKDARLGGSEPLAPRCIHGFWIETGFVRGMLEFLRTWSWTGPDGWKTPRAHMWQSSLHWRCEIDFM